MKINYDLKFKEELEKITLKFVVKCNNGKVFGSISSKQIHEELLKLGYKVDKKIIKIKKWGKEKWKKRKTHQQPLS